MSATPVAWLGLFDFRRFGALSRPSPQVRGHLPAAADGSSTVSRTLSRVGVSGVSERQVTDQFTNHMLKAPSLFEKGPLALVAGAGFEPATSGL